MHHRIQTGTEPTGMKPKVTVGISWECIQLRWVSGCYKPRSLCLISNGWMDLQGQGAVEVSPRPAQAKILIKTFSIILCHLSAYKCLEFRFLVSFSHHIIYHIMYHTKTPYTVEIISGGVSSVCLPVSHRAHGYCHSISMTLSLSQLYTM